MPNTFLDQTSKPKKAKDGRSKTELQPATARILTNKEVRAKIMRKRRKAELREMGFKES